MLADKAAGVYKKLVIKDNRIHGAVMIGDTVDGPWYFQMMRAGQSIADIRPMLLYGQAHLGDAGHGGAIAITAMGDNAEICGCNGGVQGARSSRPSSRKNCSRSKKCARIPRPLLPAARAPGWWSRFSPPPSAAITPPRPREKPLCKCTDYTHDEVRQAIRERRLISIRAVMDTLEWKNSDGCASCRPALNYYLISTWPVEAKDDYQSRFINERAHANIQRDGTYSVVPRIWGGVVTPKELHTIADVAEKFAVPEVKITGGQRIDLLGIPKEQLPAVWRELGKVGLVSGHAYAKAIRTVKTCVGKEWCRFGVQDSTRMGIDIEKMCWGSWTPHKVKLAVSGCPRNCAESTIKDFGVVAVDSGWELHVGGNGGVKVRVTDLLCKVATPEEVLEYCGAFLQLYREEARYLERTAHWIERVGLTYVKSRMVDDAGNRQTLHARFLASQRLAQHDPWGERANQRVDEHEFAPLKQIA